MRSHDGFDGSAGSLRVCDRVMAVFCIRPLLIPALLSPLSSVLSRSSAPQHAPHCDARGAGLSGINLLQFVPRGVVRLVNIILGNIIARPGDVAEEKKEGSKYSI